MKQTMGLIQNILTIGKRIGGGRIFVLLTLILSSVACSAEKQPANPEIDVMFSVPETIEVQEGSPFVSFRIMFGKSPLATDIVIL